MTGSQRKLDTGGKVNLSLSKAEMTRVAYLTKYLHRTEVNLRFQIRMFQEAHETYKTDCKTRRALAEELIPLYTSTIETYKQTAMILAAQGRHGLTKYLCVLHARRQKLLGERDGKGTRD